MTTYKTKAGTFTVLNNSGIEVRKGFASAAEAEAYIATMQAMTDRQWNHNKRKVA